MFRRRHAPGRRRAAAFALLAAFVTAGLLIEPLQGRQRRVRLLAALRRGERHVGRAGRHLAAETHGLSERMRHPRPAEPPDDHTLLDRVQSELFADPEVPKGRLNLDVERGIVVVRGALENPAQIRRTESALRRVPGVHEVHSLLHVVGTPAPNKASALRASAVAAWREGR